MVSKAVLENGLPESSLPAFILDLSTRETDQLSTIPRISPKIISAGVLALEEAYLDSFHSIWIAACSLFSLGIIGKFTDQATRLLAKYVWNSLVVPCQP